MFGKSLKYLFFFLFLCNFVLLAHGIERDMTISVPPGREECFYETLKIGQTLDIDYQVIDGGQGDLDISFHLTSPSNRVIVMDYKKSEQSHRHEIAENGDYKMCYDNKFSSFNTKIVYFEILIDSDEDEDLWGNLNAPTPEEQYEIAIQDIQWHFVKKPKIIYNGLTYKATANELMIRHMQETARAFALRDKYTADGNFFLVNTWSLVQITVMLIVGFVQVVMVKSLFDEQSKMHKLWTLK